MDEIIKIQPASVLEVGPGPGFFKALANSFGLSVETLDIDPELQPDHLASVFEIPFADKSFDVVCAFQMLEYLPYSDSLRACREMVRVCRKGVIISLPDARGAWPFIVGLPRGREITGPMPSPRFWSRVHKFDGELYWEVNARDYHQSRIIKDFSGFGLTMSHSYRVDRNPVHRFFVFVPE